MALAAAASGSNVGAFGQHRTPSGSGSISPREFTIGGQTYAIRGWYTDAANRLVVNMDSSAQEAAFVAAGLTVDLGQGQTIDTGDMTNSGGILTIAVTAQYVSGQSYTINITE